MKTSLLTGPLLDYWTAMAYYRNPAHMPARHNAFFTTGDAVFVGIRDKGQGPLCYIVRTVGAPASLITPEKQSIPGKTHTVAYSPSTDWAAGGPVLDTLIARGFEVAPLAIGMICRDHAHVSEYGDTALQAICRARVAASLGDNVPEYPD